MAAFSISLDIVSSPPASRQCVSFPIGQLFFQAFFLVLQILYISHLFDPIFARGTGVFLFFRKHRIAAINNYVWQRLEGSLCAAVNLDRLLRLKGAASTFLNVKGHLGNRDAWEWEMFREEWGWEETDTEK